MAHRSRCWQIRRVPPAEAQDASVQSQPNISSNSMPLAPKTLMNQGRLPLEKRPVPRSAQEHGVKRLCSY